MQQLPSPSLFIPDDPNAHLAGPDACLYLTTTTTKYGSIMFDGHFWNIEGSALVKSGFISQNRIIFSASITSHERKTDYQGHFSSDDVKYFCSSVCKTDSGFNLSRFSLKNQKLAFDPPSVAVDEQVSKPISVFFLYKQDTFQTVHEQNPSFKFSQIDAMISQNWENLDEWTRTCYQLIYEEQVERYKESWVVPFVGEDSLRKRVMDLNQSEWDDEIVLDAKRWRPNRPNPVLTQIHKAVFHSINFYFHNGDEYVKKHHDGTCYKNTWKKTDSWITAIDDVNEEYRKHLEYYKNKKREYREWDERDDGWNLPRYVDKGEKFEAVMVDLTKGDVLKIPDFKLSSELRRRAHVNVPRTKRYLIAYILRERDFDPQTIKGVLDFASPILAEISDESGNENDNESDNES